MKNPAIKQTWIVWGFLLLLYALFVASGFFIHLDPEIPTWLVFLLAPIFLTMAIFAFPLAQFMGNGVVAGIVFVLSVILFLFLLWLLARLLVKTYHWYHWVRN